MITLSISATNLESRPSGGINTQTVDSDLIHFYTFHCRILTYYILYMHSNAVIAVEIKPTGPLKTLKDS